MRAFRVGLVALGPCFAGLEQAFRLAPASSFIPTGDRLVIMKSGACMRIAHDITRNARAITRIVGMGIGSAHGFGEA